LDVIYLKILVVDDEKLLVKGIKFNLENEGYDVDACYDGTTAVEMIRKGSYDLIVLDLMLPGMDGLDVCMSVRSFSNVPIIMLTAKSDSTDMLLGFDYGADDYIAKPFNILELKARVRVHLRRRVVAPNTAEEKLIRGHIMLDPSRSKVEKSGQPVDLTIKEFDLLELLMRNTEKVYTREELLELVWGGDYQGDVRTVDVHIRRLREKLELDSSAPRYIMTKWGRGYYFAE
jgi:two-component system response regulator VicR